MNNVYFSIRSKLLILSLIVVITNTSFVRWFLSDEVKTELTAITIEHLKSIRASKSRQIESYFDRIRRHIDISSNDYAVIDAMKAFSAAYEGLPVISNGVDFHHEYRSLSEFYQQKFFSRLKVGHKKNSKHDLYFPNDPRAVTLQYRYMVSPDNPDRKFDWRAQSKQHDQYDQIHKKYHPLFKRFSENFGFYDIFLVDHRSGNIVYTTSKEVDFATSLVSGPYKNTNLGRLFKQAQRATTTNFIKLQDFAHYPPSYNEPASFIASPIFDRQKKVGILIFQLPINAINDVMTGNENWYLDGHGRTGENILLGRDGFFRSQSRFLIEHPEALLEDLAKMDHPSSLINDLKLTNSSILTLKFTSDEFQSGAQKNTLDGLVDYRGNPTYTAYKALDIQDVDWLIVTKIDTEEVFENLSSSIFSDPVKISFYLLVFLPFIYWVISIILKPLQIISDQLKSETPEIKSSFPIENNILKRVEQLSDTLTRTRRTCLQFHNNKPEKWVDTQKHLPDLLLETILELNGKLKFSRNTLKQAKKILADTQRLWPHLYAKNLTTKDSSEDHHEKIVELIECERESIQHLQSTQGKVDRLIMLTKSLNFHSQQTLQRDLDNVTLPTIISELRQIESLCFEIKMDINMSGKKVSTDYAKGEQLIRRLSVLDLLDQNGSPMDPIILENIQQNITTLQQLVEET